MLFTVLGLAAYLRFAGIATSGIRFDDESWYASDARLWHRCIRAAAEPGVLAAIAAGDKDGLKPRLEKFGIDFNDRYQKPSQGYTLLGAMVMFAAGDRPEALNILNAIFGTLAVLLIFLLARLWLGTSLGLVASYLLAVSPYHLFYCRSALADATAGCFVLAGTFFWTLAFRRMSRRPWASLFAGIAFGWGITCHYRIGYIPMVIVLTELVWLRNVGPKVGEDFRGMSVFRRAAWLFAGALISVGLLEGVFLMAGTAARMTDGYFPIQSYVGSLFSCLGRVFEHAGVDQRSFPQIGAMWTYGEYFIHRQGWAFLVLVAMGALVTLSVRSAAVIGLVLVATTFLLLACQRYVVARALSPMVPYICILAACGLAAIIQTARFSERRSMVMLATCTVLSAFPAFAQSLDLVWWKSDLPTAAAAMESLTEGTVAVPLNSRKYTLYMENNRSRVTAVTGNTSRPPNALDIEGFRDQGVRYLVVDPQPWHFRGAPGGEHILAWWLALDDLLRGQANLVDRFSHVEGAEWSFLAEGWGGRFASDMAAAHGGQIRIYDISNHTEGDEAAQSPSRGVALMLRR